MKNYHSRQKRINCGNEPNSKISSKRSKFTSKNYDSNNFEDFPDYLSEQSVRKNGKIIINPQSHHKKQDKTQKIYSHRKPPRNVQWFEYINNNINDCEIFSTRDGSHGRRNKLGKSRKGNYQDIMIKIEKDKEIDFTADKDDNKSVLSESVNLQVLSKDKGNKKAQNMFKDIKYNLRGKSFQNAYYYKIGYTEDKDKVRRSARIAKNELKKGNKKDEKKADKHHQKKKNNKICEKKEYKENKEKEQGKKYTEEENIKNIRKKSRSQYNKAKIDNKKEAQNNKGIPKKNRAPQTNYIDNKQNKSNNKNHPPSNNSVANNKKKLIKELSEKYMLSNPRSDKKNNDLIILTKILINNIENAPHKNILNTTSDIEPKNKLIGKKRKRASQIPKNKIENKNKTKSQLPKRNKKKEIKPKNNKKGKSLNVNLIIHNDDDEEIYLEDINKLKQGLNCDKKNTTKNKVKKGTKKHKSLKKNENKEEKLDEINNDELKSVDSYSEPDKDFNNRDCFNQRIIINPLQSNSIKDFNLNSETANFIDSNNYEFSIPIDFEEKVDIKEDKTYFAKTSKYIKYHPIDKYLPPIANEDKKPYTSKICFPRTAKINFEKKETPIAIDSDNDITDMTSINNELNNDFLPSILNIPRIKPYREEHSKLIKEKLMQDNIKIYQSDDENLQKEERAVYVGSFLLYDEKNNIKVSVPCYRENKKTRDYMKKKHLTIIEFQEDNDIDTDEEQLQLEIDRNNNALLNFMKKVNKDKNYVDKNLVRKRKK
jgi:hypothetical protein